MSKDESEEHDNSQEKKKRQEEFLEEVESKLKRSEKDIWFVKNENHPQKESLIKNAHK